MKISKIFLSSVLACLCACNCSTEKPQNNGGETPGTDTKPVPEVKVKDVTVYVTKADRTKLFEKSYLDFGKPGSMSPNQVTYDKTATAQEVDGFGLAVTTATCYNLMQMSQADRTAFLKETFSRTEGAGSSLIRVSIGASDFCIKDEYTWCDKPGLENFAVHAEDQTYLFPILKEIYAINPDVKIIGSPWSCPKWMKGGGYRYEGFDKAELEKDYDSWTTGRLKPSCYDDYAEYFVKWVQVMEKEGFDIFALTMQNEPLNHGNSMSMYMPWQDQKEFVKVLGPAMEKAGLGDVKILLFDHNYNYDNVASQENYPLNIYADPEAYKWADGSAWHSYGGSVEELDEIYSENPEKDIYFTEASIGEWYPNFDVCLMNDFRQIFLGTLKRGGKGVTLWNLMLDDKNGPYSPQPGSCKTCFGGVTINSKDYKTITKNSHWFNMAHASAVIKPGAKKIATGGMKLPGNFELQMYLNPDNTIGVIIENDTDKEQSLVFPNTKFTVKYTVPAKSLASLLWQE